MDQQINKQEPSSTEGGQVKNPKVGDKVWVLCDVNGFDRKAGQVRVSGHHGGSFWTTEEDCRPVEPLNCSEIPNSSSDPIKVGDAVRFVLAGHDRHGAEGIIFSIVKGPNREYHFQSNCGQFHRYCTIAELERIIKRYRTPTLADLANGPIACEYRDSDEEQWRSGFLVHILNGAIPFLCVNEEQELSGQWDQCRIEVGE
jgi:hypothetical protein